MTDSNIGQERRGDKGFLATHRVSMDMLQFDTKVVLPLDYPQGIIANAKEDIEYIRGQAYYQLRTTLLGKRDVVEDHIVLSVQAPMDWWQHWKHQHAPRWMKQRWPVRYRVHRECYNLEKTTVYPECPMALDPQLGRAYVYEEIRPHHKETYIR